MNNFFSIIGTIASIGSIPLSIYLFIKNRENNVDRVKRDIVKILSHQIGDRRQLTTFEIQTVINSKTRESKIDSEKITINQIIEDLVSETISNPLLEKAIKEVIIDELKNIYFKSELLTSIDNIELETRADKNVHDQDINIESEIKKIIEQRSDVKDVMERQRKIFSRTSESFAIIAIITTFGTTILTYIGKDKYDSLTKPVYDFLHNNDFYVSIAGSVLAAVTAFVVLLIFRKFKRK